MSVDHIMVLAEVVVRVPQDSLDLQEDLVEAAQDRHLLLLDHR